MAENKKYYWLKLKNDFFTDKRIKKLRKIAGGDTYTIIYLKMQLLSLKNEGKLFFDNVEETFEEEIALEIDENIEDVKITIGFLINNGLLEQVEVDEYELTETINCIGSETRNAECMRKLRKSRNEHKELEKSVTMLQDVTKSYTEKEIEIEKEIEKDKKHKYGVFKRVSLTDKEYSRLVEEYGKEYIDLIIKKLDEYVESNNNKNKYSNFNLVIRKAIRENWYTIEKLPKWFNKEVEIEEPNQEVLDAFEELQKVLE